MGFVTPFTIRGTKKLIQDLAKERIGWDEPLRKQHLSNGQEWFKELEPISAIKTSRCLTACWIWKCLPKWTASPLSCLNHRIRMRSESYLRVVNKKVHVSCNLLLHHHASSLSSRRLYQGSSYSCSSTFRDKMTWCKKNSPLRWMPVSSGRTAP